MYDKVFLVYMGTFTTEKYANQLTIVITYLYGCAIRVRRFSTAPIHIDLIQKIA